MTLAAGTRLGSYEIVAPTGRGGTGLVYRARDLTLGREVAIKVLAGDAASDAAAPADLLREARHASSLSHQNICPIHHVGESDGRAFVVMELVRGQTLDALIPPGGLPIEQVLRYGVQLAAGTAHAHERHIVHGDLKCGNVMIAPNGRVQILDFGLARRLPAGDVDEVTRSQGDLGAGAGISGTLPYMAPELLAGEPATPASDVWAIGVMLHEMSAGERPFRGGSGFELSSAIIRDTAAALPERVPAPLAALIARCLAKNPSERYQTASELHAALEVVASVFASGSTAATAGSISPEARRSGAARRRWALAAAAVGVGAAALIVMQLRFDSGDARTYQLVSTFPGAHQAGSFSPDGTSVAFIQDDANGIPQVWIKNLAQGEPVPITEGDRPASRPRWTATNDHIVFARRGAGIWSVPVFGGPPRQIVPQGSNPDVAADGRTIVFELGRELWVVTDDGSEPRPIAGFPPRVYSIPYTPAISPDGRLVAFFRAELGPNGDFWVAPVDGGEATRLTNDLREGGSPVWTADGAEIVFSSTRGGSRTLWRIAATGGEPAPVTSGAGDDLEPDLAGGSGEIVYTNVRNTWRLHIRDLRTGADRVLFERREPILWPRFSPDGLRLAFFGPSASSAAQVFVVSREGTAMRALTDRRGELNTMPRWSADGESILFYQMIPGRTLLEVPVAGGVSREVVALDWDRAPGAVMHPDGRSLAYFSRENGGATIVRSLPDGNERPLAMALQTPQWSRDGRDVAGQADGMIVICPAVGTACRQVTRGAHPVWSADGTGLYFLRPGESAAFRTLWRLEVATGAEREVARLGPMRVIDVTFDISSRDELVWAEFSPGRPELWRTTLSR
jgi:Tol biopolymer transport system component